MSDVKARLAYLVSQEGSIRGVARRYPSLKKSTISDVLNGKPTSQKTRDRINANFRRNADADAKDRERSGKTPGTALVDEATARRLYASLRRQGFTPDRIRVTARVVVSRTIPGVPGVTGTDDVIVARGTDVDAAKTTLGNRLNTYSSSYAGLSITIDSQVLYRIYAKE